MNKLAYNETFSCVQCGYCLPVCPTYLTTKQEAHSPRGRINLVKRAAEGKISYETLKEPMELCLGCRACEVACPTNVQYGKILDAAKVALRQKTKRRKTFREFALNQTVKRQGTLKMARTGLALYERTGMRKVVERSGAINVLPKQMRTFAKALPNDAGPFFERRGRNLSKTQHPMYKIGFFTGCLMDVMFSRVNTLSVKLLEAFNCQVTLVKDEVCCGALSQHQGDIETAKHLAKQNIIAFEQEDFDYIVNSIGGCGAMLKEYTKLFKDDPKWKKRAQRFSKKVIDISVLLLKLPLDFKRSLHKTVTYQPSCHLLHVQRVKDAPLQLMRKIPNLTFVDMPKSELCCGSAGDYNIMHYEASMAILDHKMDYVSTIDPLPDMIITSNPGCYLQMKIGLERKDWQKEISVLHLVELIAEACDIS